MDRVRDRFDMHIHSTVSDGHHSPTQLAKMVWEKGLLGFALTDHDTAAGCAGAEEEGKKLGITVIPGIELSSEIGEKDVHVLGYWVDPIIIENDEQMINMRQSRYTRCYKMVERLNRLGMGLDADAILAEAAECGSPGRPLVAEAIVRAGYAEGRKDAFTKWLVRGAPGYVPRAKLSPVDAVKVILRCGGVAVLAHPGAGVPDRIIPDMVKAGLGGIEVWHPEHNGAAEKKYRQLASVYGLAVTGGSDFHQEGARTVGAYNIGVDQLSLLAEKREAILKIFSEKAL